MLKNKTFRVYIVLINARHVSQSKLSRLDQVSSLLESRLKGYIIPMNPIISSLRQQSVCMGMCVCACLFGLRLKGGGQHLWEQFEEDGKKELHEGDDDKHHEGHQTEEVSTGPHQLQQIETVQDNSIYAVVLLTVGPSTAEVEEGQPWTRGPIKAQIKVYSLTVRDAPI